MEEMKLFNNQEDTSVPDYDYEILKLDSQLCFSLYVCSKEIIKKYKPLLDPYDLTYTGYIILLALWENDQITVKDLGKKLYLDSGTLTPLLKKLEAKGYIDRIRSTSDERNVYIRLTKKGNEFKKDALNIPKEMICTLDLKPDEANQLLQALHSMMRLLSVSDTSKE
jgi:DNA-binding MarR family transcriptional regulator